MFKINLSKENKQIKSIFMKKLTFIITLVALTFMTNAQIKVASNNSVGIGTENPISKLSVGADGNSDANMYFYHPFKKYGLISKLDPISGTYCYGLLSYVNAVEPSYKLVGLQGSVYSSTPKDIRTFGIRAISGNGIDGYNYSIWSALDGSRNGTAIFANAYNTTEYTIPGRYAAYLLGKVYISENVGIGITSPSYKLDVNGDIHTNGYLRGYGIITTSDLSAKENIQDLEKDKINKIKELKAVTYNYKQQELETNESLFAMASDTGVVNIQVDDLLSEEITNKEQIGFIAQDLQKVYPELVVADKDGMLGINYTGLIPILVEVIKEQQFQIDALEIKVEKLGVK